MSLFETRDVTTGRFIQMAGAGVGKDWAAHKGQDAWWVTTISTRSEDSSPNGQTYEVCLINIGPHHSSPTWPILTFCERGMRLAKPLAVEWEAKLRQFAKTLDPKDTFTHCNAEGNDTRLMAWLSEHGFKRYNRIWWTR